MRIIISNPKHTTIFNVNTTFTNASNIQSSCIFPDKSARKLCCNVQGQGTMYTPAKRACIDFFIQTL